MAGYVKVFRQIFDGSLYGKFEPTVTFLVLLVLAERGGIVDMTPEAIAAKSGFPLDVIRKGITDLEQPDPRSRTEADEGRRIIRLESHRDWGWQIVNYDKYDRMRSTEERREYFRVHKREQRAKAREAQSSVQDVHRVSTLSTDVTPSSSSSSSSKNIDRSDLSGLPELRLDLSPPENYHKSTPPYPVAFHRVVEKYPRRAGSQPIRPAFGCWKARLLDGDSEAEIEAGVERYAAFCQATGKVGTEFVLRLTTFLGRDAHYRNSWIAPPAPNGAALGASAGAGEAWDRVLRFVRAGEYRSSRTCGDPKADKAVAQIGGFARIGQADNFQVRTLERAFRECFA